MPFGYGKIIGDEGNTAASATFDTLTLNKYVETLPCYAFKEAVIGELLNVDKIKTIESYCFEESTINNSLNFESIETIGTQAFHWFKGNLTFGKNLKTIDIEAFKNIKTDTICLKSYQGELPEGLFFKSNIKEVILPRNCKNLPINFLYASTIKKLTGYSKVETFGKYCLADCDNLLLNIDFTKVKLVRVIQAE